jgi:hypothetical protein
MAGAWKELSELLILVNCEGAGSLIRWTRGTCPLRLSCNYCNGVPS